jgi:exodeoxyribonuclease V gamma subunit
VLHIHRAERTDGFVDALAAVLTVQPEDPFQADVIAVPARGIERWLTQRLSHVLGGGPDAAGVCANLRFLSPGALIDEVLDAAGSALDDDPWAPDALPWHLLDALDRGAMWPSATLERRLVGAHHVAGLFGAYGTQRPGLVRAWADGPAVPGDLGWESELWRRLRADLGRPSPAERLPDLCAELRTDPAAADLPDRLSVFGPTRLTRDQLTVLSALAEHRDVHLWLPHPSPVLWDAVAPFAAQAAASPRRTDPTAVLPRHPLLASLGRDSRELQLLLSGAETQVEHHHHPMRDRPSTLLGRLQSDIARDQMSPPARLSADDSSLQIHACHGPARQVEVLREVLLGLLEDDPTLEPRDVLVMCPDIEGYAPLISAAFGLSDEGEADHPGHRLRVKLADRSLRQTNPLLGTISALLELADARVTASQVLDLAASAPVRRRFRFDDEDLELLRDWVVRTGVRWGVDAAHRSPFKMSQVAQNTWQTGLDRLLLGATLSEDEARWLGPALPLDDVDSNDVDLAGRLAELLDRLADVLASLNREQPLTEWLTALTNAVDALTAVTDQDAWQQTQARRELADVARSAGARADSIRLTLDDVRALLADRLRGRPTRANFRTGSLTMCSMVPMRSVPHRVICLLGIDDGAFPRNTVVNGDDLLAREPIVGERDRRSEDRQLLLDAILAAEEHLAVLYTGADERTNARRPPAVPVGEILDLVDAMVTPEQGQTGRDRVVVRHPLQPFDSRNFASGALGRDGPFSFDRPSLDGARAAAGPRRPPPRLLDGPLPRVLPDPVELDGLIRFLEHPVRGFLRQRLQFSVTRDEEDVADDLTVELGGLERWGIGERMLQAQLAGADASAVGQAEYRRGSLPPGTLGSRLFKELLADLDPLLRACADLRRPAMGTVDVSVELPDDRRLAGTVGGVHASTLVRVTYSKLGANHRVRAWAQLLALAVAHPDVGWRAVTVGRPARGKGAQRSTLGPVGADQARLLLAELVDLHERGLREPLPMAVKTSARYASLRSTNKSVDVALQLAERAWTGKFGEHHDREHELVWGPESELEVLVADAASPDEQWFDEPSRFGALARRLWTPLLAAETVDDI